MGGVEDKLAERLRGLRGSDTLILGIGNELKGDDGAGPFLCGLLEGKTNAKVIDGGTVPENYIQRIVKAKPEKLLIIDAVDFGAEAGEARIFKVEQLSGVVMSTHSLSPRLFIDLVRSQIEVDVLLLGIQPAQTKLAQGLSPVVESVGRELARILMDTFRG